jgi:hypothetical protein
LFVLVVVFDEEFRDFSGGPSQSVKIEIVSKPKLWASALPETVALAKEVTSVNKAAGVDRKNRAAKMKEKKKVAIVQGAAHRATSTQMTDVAVATQLTGR